MIVFCEDCGSKNLLNPDQIRNDQMGHKIVSFTCQTCQYKNAYKMDNYPNSHPDQYTKTLREILSASSIIGIFIFHENKGIINNLMPKILKESDLLFLSKHLINAHRESGALFPDTDKTIWNIGDTHLTVKSLGNSLFIVLASNTPALPNHVASQLDILSDLSGNFTAGLPSDIPAGLSSDFPSGAPSK